MQSYEYRTVKEAGIHRVKSGTETMKGISETPKCPGAHAVAAILYPNMETLVRCGAPLSASESI